MKAGTLEKSLEDLAERIADKSGRRALFGGAPGGGEHGDGGGDDDDFFQEAPYPSNKYRIFTWFLLLVVLMTFCGLIGAYVVVSTNGVLEWRPFSLPPQVWISTAMILVSSLAYHLGFRALGDGKQDSARKFFLGTAILGGMFIASQLLVWLAIAARGVYLQSNPYAGFFYVLTAVHALHVAGGIAALGYVVVRSWVPTRDDEELKRRRLVAGPVGWYWHFMDGMWIVLLLFLGFWK